MKPRIFISAVTKELRSARQIVANTLMALGYEPIWQDIFGMSGEDIRPMLRNKIDSCSAVLQIVGKAYGAEPSAADEQFGRVSYTQYEALYARAAGKKVYYLIAQPDMPRDAPPESVDASHEDSDAGRADANQRRQLQHNYRASIQSTEHISYAVQSHPEVELAVHRLKDELDRLRRGFKTWMVAVTAGLILIAGGVAWVNRDQWKLAKSVEEGQKKTAEQIEATGEKTKEAMKEVLESAVKELTNPGALAERIRKEIHATAEAKINALPDAAGRGRQISEIEKERDLAIGRVNDLVKLIQEGLKEGASPVFQRAADILQKEGTDEALAYLESRRQSTLDDARRHADQAKASQARAESEKELRNKSLQALVLEAELQESKLQWEAALKLREQVAELAPDWFEARNAVGLLHLNLARFREAELNLRAAVKLATTNEEAVALNNLALLLKDTNRLADAEPLYRRALAIDDQSYGAEHPRVATRLNNLAVLLKVTNRLAEAEPLMRRALAIDEQSYGAEHPNVAIRLNNLAQLLKHTNRLAEAKPLMRRALAIDEQSYGAEHPNVATDLNNLAQLLKDTNRLAEAEPLYRRALAIEEQSYGAEHPSVAIDLNNLAQLLQDTNRLAEAEPLMRRALAIDEQSYGAEHPNVARDLNNLAQLLKDTNRLAEAEPLYRRALAIEEQSYGAEHPEVATDLNNLAQLFQATNRLAEAEPLMRRALAIDEQSYGAEHPSVSIDLNNLAQLLKATNRLAEAEPLLRRALAIDEQSKGAEHPRVARDLNNLATLLEDTHRLAEAEPLMRRALAIDEQSYGAEHPNVAIRLNNLAQLLQATNRLAEAEPLMRRALAIFAMSLVAKHPNTVTVQGNYRQLLSEMTLGDTEIKERIEEAMSTKRPLQSIAPEVDRLLGPAKPVAEVLAVLDRQYRDEGRPEVYFLKSHQPIAPHLDELLSATRDRLVAQGLSAFNKNFNAQAMALFEAAAILNRNQDDADEWLLNNRMYRGAALRDLGALEQARDELQKVADDRKEEENASQRLLGRCLFHLAECQFRLGASDAAITTVKESLKRYESAPEDSPVPPALVEQSRQLLAKLEAETPPPPRKKVDVEAELLQARKGLEATQKLATLALDQPSTPLLDQMLGPAKSTAEVMKALDEQYRQDGKPPVYFLPLDQPIAPHLDELLGPSSETKSSP